MQKNPGADALRDLLGLEVPEVYGEGARVDSLMRLSGGASRETWSFDVLTADGARVPLILKRDPLVFEPDGSIAPEEQEVGVSRATEGRLIELAGAAGVPVPAIPFYLAESEQTTPGFVMERLEGETLGRRILREEVYKKARTNLAFECGRAAAGLHGIAVADLPPLASMTPVQELEHNYEIMSRFDHPYAGFEYGFRWLEERLEWAGESHALCHGDFRLGNILVDSEGLRGVLDWELAHLGNPLSDLGWLCVRSWRYSYFAKPVGGFGEVSDLLEGYESGGGGRVSPDALRYWEVFGTLRWGVLCISMLSNHLLGSRGSIEKAVIGRRTAETEYDLLQVID